MNILITGICGFVGSSLATAWLEAESDIKVYGLDNFIRPESEHNRNRLKKMGVTLYHGDIRLASDFDALPPVDWVIEAAANPSVLAGTDGQFSSRQLVEHNLQGTVNILEYRKRHGAGFILISTSRVYSIPPLASLPVVPCKARFWKKVGTRCCRRVRISVSSSPIFRSCFGMVSRDSGQNRVPEPPAMTTAYL